MRKPKVIWMDDDGTGALYDNAEGGAYIASTTFDLADYEEPRREELEQQAGPNTDLVEQLAALGYSADDLVKLKATGVI